MITEIRYDITRNLGDYNNRKLGVTVSVAETETADIQHVMALVQWHVDRPEKLAIRDQYIADLARFPENPTEAQIAFKAKMEAYIAEFDANDERFNAS